MVGDHVYRSRGNPKYTTFEEHLVHVEKVFTQLIKYKLTVKLSKCKFFQLLIKFLGHLVSHNSISVNPDIISVVKQWKRPESKDRKSIS